MPQAKRNAQTPTAFSTIDTVLAARNRRLSLQQVREPASPTSPLPLVFSSASPPPGPVVAALVGSGSGVDAQLPSVACMVADVSFAERLLGYACATKTSFEHDLKSSVSKRLTVKLLKN